MTRIAVGKIVNVHGIKGVMKFQPMLSSAQILSRLNPLSDKENKKHFEMTLVGKKGAFWLVSAKGITDRTTAERFKGMELFADREKFPETAEGEFYCCDLMGMDVIVGTGSTTARAKAGPTTPPSSPPAPAARRKAGAPKGAIPPERRPAPRSRPSPPRPRARCPRNSAPRSTASSTPTSRASSASRTARA